MTAQDKQTGLWALEVTHPAGSRGRKRGHVYIVPGTQAEGSRPEWLAGDPDSSSLATPASGCWWVSRLRAELQGWNLPLNPGSEEALCPAATQPACGPGGTSALRTDRSACSWSPLPRGLHSALPPVAHGLACPVSSDTRVTVQVNPCVCCGRAKARLCAHH